jgi:type I restriction enzyme, S subunit
MSDVILQKGWAPACLGDILELKYGKSLAATVRDGVGHPVFGSNGIVGKHSEPLVQTEGLIVGRKGSVGEVQYSSCAFFPIDTTYFVDEFYLQPIKYWYYQLKNLPLTELNRSTAIPGLNRDDAYEQKIAVPPIAEQREIARRLDDLLAQVDSIKTRLDKLPQILKRFRQSTLAAATSGKLTEEWRGENKYLNEFPASWPEIKLSELGVLARGKSKHRPRNDSRLFGTEYPFIQTGEVANSGGLITEATKFYSAFGLKQSRLFPVGTLCITIAANIADTAILDIEACFPDSVVGFSPDTRKCSALFMKYLIDVNKANLEAFAPATAQKNINLKVLNALVFATPSFEEQTEIVRRVTELFAFADQVEQRVAAAQVHVNHLTQSILAKAFRGELTEQWRRENPDLITGENSAAALLKRIKSERKNVAIVRPKQQTRKSNKSR